jgi:hypothetical protein
MAGYRGVESFDVHRVAKLFLFYRRRGRFRELRPPCAVMSGQVILGKDRKG